MSYCCRLFIYCMVLICYGWNILVACTLSRGGNRLGWARLWNVQSSPYSFICWNEKSFISIFLLFKVRYVTFLCSSDKSFTELIDLLKHMLQKISICQIVVIWPRGYYIHLVWSIPQYMYVLMMTYYIGRSIEIWINVWTVVSQATSWRTTMAMIMVMLARSTPC